MRRFKIVITVLVLALLASLAANVWLFQQARGYYAEVAGRL